MPRFEIRLLGGFQVLRDGAPRERFESQRVRALLAYLARHRDRQIARALLAGLLWPDESTATARHNLRQAIYNLRLALGAGRGSASTALIADHQALRFAPEADLWFDVDAFERAVAAGLEAEGSVRVRELARAAELYRGDFLVGFHLEASEGFEEWLSAERERLRETATQALQVLSTTLAARGEHRYAIRHARQLVELDPLSEEAHQALMRLYAQSGQRERALAQFQDLNELLQRELGIQPLAETRELWRSILDQRRPAAALPEESAGPSGPLVPLVGRAEVTRRLRASFDLALGDGVRLALIEGEAGVGKTRLAKTCLDEVTSGRRIRVLLGRCYPSPQPVAFQPFADAVHAIAGEELPRAARAPVGDLAGLLPAPGSTGWPAAPPARSAPAERVFALVVRLLEALCRPAGGRPVEPVALFLDDLQWADGSTLALLDHLLRELAGLPVWLLATWEDGAAGRDHPLRPLVAGATGRPVDTVRLGRLGGDAVTEIVAALTGDDDARLAAFLTRHGEGLPLQVVELINLLCDDGVLQPLAPLRWGVAAADALDGLAVPGTLDALILSRLAHLPTSVRRLLSLAAVIGRTFDVGLLQRAATEHPGVVEIAVQVMRERWFVRPFRRLWAGHPRGSELTLWGRGVRRGSFEFSHHRIHEAIYQGLEPSRRRRLHLRAADVMHEESAESTAYHWEQGGEPERAIPLLLTAARRAAARDDRSSALGYCRRAQDALEQAVGGAAGAGGWRDQRRAIEDLRRRLTAP